MVRLRGASIALTLGARRHVAVRSVPMIDQRQEGNGRNVVEPTKGKKRPVSRARPSEAERRALELAESERELRANARTALAEAREVLADTREDLKRTSAALDSARRTAESRAVEVTEAERRLRRAREEVEREVRARTSAEAKLERARFQIESGKTELRAAHERLVQAQGRVKPRAARRIADLRADLAAAREACDAESKRRAELEREVGTHTAEIETLRVKSAEQAKDVSAAREALEAAKTNMDWLKSRLESGDAAADGATRELEQLQEAHEEVTADLEREREASAAARTDVEQITAELKGAQIDLVKQFSDAKHDLEQLQEAHQSVTAELENVTAELAQARADVEPRDEAPVDSVEADDPNEEPPATEPDVSDSASAPEPSPLPEPESVPLRRVSRNGDQFAAIVDTDLGPRERRRARAALEALSASLDGEILVGLALGRDDNGDCLMAVTDGGLRIIGLEGGDRGRVPYERITSVDCHQGRFGRLRLRVASDDGEILVAGWAERVGRIDYKVRNYLWKKTVERTT